MTETTLDRMDVLDPIDEPAPSRRKLLVAGGLAAALVLGAGGYLLLGTGGDDTALGTPPPRAPRVATKPVAKAAAKKPFVAKPAAKIPLASKEHLGRDPFKALYVVPVAAVATGPTAPTVTTSGTTGTTSGTSTGSTPGSSTGSTTGTTTGGGTTGTTTGSTTGTMPYTLVLTAISKPSPQVRFFTFTVAGKSATVIPAQRFGKYGELIVLAYTTSKTGTATGAVIQVGDDNPIEVRIGEKVSVL